MIVASRFLNSTGIQKELPQEKAGVLQGRTFLRPARFEDVVLLLKKRIGQGRDGKKEKITKE